MNKLFKFFSITVVIFLIVFPLFACSFDEEKNKHLSGGIFLNDEMMSQIANEMSENESNIVTEIQNNNNIEGQDGTDKNEIESEENSSNDTVYWTTGGSVWHTSKECYHISKSDSIISGSVSDAQESGKKRVCSNCSE